MRDVLRIANDTFSVLDLLEASVSLLASILLESNICLSIFLSVLRKVVWLIF